MAANLGEVAQEPRVTVKTFDRSLEPRLLSMLEEAARAGWWRDVLEDGDLIVALRGRSVNVYWKGQSLFRVEAGPGAIRATTHEKYLLDPRLGGQIAFDGSCFDVAKLEAKAFLRDYESHGSLKRMKRAAAIYSGEEKTGCHLIAVANPQVIDVEIAFPGTVEGDVPGNDVTTPRIDLLELEAFGDTGARLVFWEAKTFGNPELGSSRSSQDAPVLAQIATYRTILEAYRGDLEASYTRLCTDLRRMRAAAGQKVDPIVEAVADGRRQLTLGDTPKVNLLVFGFDAAQKDHDGWKRHSATLNSALAAHGARMRAVGDPKGKRL